MVDQREGALIGQQAVAGDRHRAMPEDPGCALLMQACKDLGHVIRVGHPVRGRRWAIANFDTDVRSAKDGERVLVGYVITQEQHRVGSERMAQMIERHALVVVKHRKLDHALAVAQNHTLVARPRRADRRGFDGAGLVVGGAVVKSRAGGFDLDRRSRNVVGTGSQVERDLLEQHRLGGVQAPDHVRLVFGSVTADQVNFIGQP